MKEKATLLVVFLAFSTVLAVADGVVQVASFPAVQYNKYVQEKKIFPDSVAWIDAYGGDEITNPFLIRRGSSFGINDFVQGRILWLKENFTIDHVSTSEGLGEEQGSGYRVETFPNGAVYLYKSSQEPARKVYIQLTGQSSATASGVWFQSEVLFFYDMAGQLHVIENPGESAAENLKKLKDAAYAKKLLLGNTTGRFEGLIWSDSYGIMRNGFPLAKTYTKEWDLFFADKRKASKLQPNERRQLPGNDWKPDNVDLRGISDDGTVYWGNGPIAVVDSNGFFVHLSQWDEGVAYGPIVLPSGDILLQFLKWKENRYNLYLIKRTW
jgi:hypothetical protein